MLVRLVAYTPHPDLLTAKAAMICYSKKQFDNIKISKNHKELMIKNLLKKGHLSPFEHVSWTFSISSISRACLCQLTRHRIASYSVKSQRYTLSNGFVNPFKENTLEWKLFKEQAQQIFEFYNGLLKKGVAKEDARAILPNATMTQLIMTANSRSLMNFFNLRRSNAAQSEIKELANKMLALVKEKAPLTFEKF